MADYSSLSNYKQLYKQIAGNTGPGITWDDSNTTGTLKQLGDQFSSLFQGSVGRAPTSDETDQMFNELGSRIGQSSSGFSDFRNNPTSARTQIAQYIGDTFQQQAKDTATQKLQDQQGQAQTLADLYRTQGKSAISSTESMLQDYSQKLFDRLRPELLTSLQAQGLLDTGGLNEAVAGAQKDLATSAQGYLADANMNVENNANAIAFGGASAPYNFQQAQILNQVPYLQQQGQTAQDQSFKTFMDNLDYTHQAQLLNYNWTQQNNAQPSLLQTMGQSFANSFGSQAGKYGANIGYGALNGGFQGLSGGAGGGGMPWGQV